MKKTFIRSFLVCTLAGCTQLVYILNPKEADTMAKKARDPELGLYVIKGDDTIKSNTFRYKREKGGEYHVLDNETMPIGAAPIYQDQDKYQEREFTRILNGRISLFVTWHTVRSGNRKVKGAGTSFPIKVNGEIKYVSYKELKAILSDCPAAIAEMNKEFSNSVWIQPKYKDYPIGDFRKLIKVLTVYNACP